MPDQRQTPDRPEDADRAGAPDLLAALRAQIDEVDIELVRLLDRRTWLGLEAGRAKALAGRAVTDATREREVLAHVAAASEGPLPLEDLLALYRQLIETIRRLEQQETHGLANARFMTRR